MLDIKTRHNYENTIDDFQHITDLAQKLSIENTGREADSWRAEYASYLFAKICRHAISLLKLQFTFSKGTTPDMAHIWDISSIAVLTRSIIDSYYVFYYLSIDECDKSESEFRRDLWKYHGACKRFNLLNGVKFGESKLEEFEKSIVTQKDKIMNSSFYQSISDTDLQRDIRKGKVAILLSNSELSKRAGINQDFYKAYFNYLSAHVHGFPYAFSQLKVFQANNSESLHLVTIMIQVGIGYLCHAVRDFVKLFPDQTQNLDARSKGLVDDWECEFRNFSRSRVEPI